MSYTFAHTKTILEFLAAIRHDTGTDAAKHTHTLTHTHTVTITEHKHTVTHTRTYTHARTPTPSHSSCLRGSLC